MNMDKKNKGLAALAIQLTQGRMFLFGGIKLI